MVDVDESRTAVKFTPGRQGARVDKIVVHHWGVDGQSHDGVVDWFCNPARGAQTSAHFVVSAGRAHCIVSPADTAWHAGDWAANLTSIGLELRPEATAGDYATAAELIRWLRTQHGDLPLRPHKDFTATACPGRWDLTRLDREARQTTTTGGTSMAMRPVPEMYPVTQNFHANATIFNYGAGHGAIDYGTPVGTPIVAPEDATVVHADWAWNLPGGANDWAARDYQIKPAQGDTRTGGGIMVGLRNSAGSRWWIAHLNSTPLNAGDVVRKGQVIGVTGNTGSSTGPHVHVSLIPARPDWGNGYFGAIDPAPYLTEAYKPTTYVAWQGAPTEGVGATSVEKDWFDMATEADLRRIVREENDRHWNYKRKKLGGAGGHVSYGEQILWTAADNAKINAKLDALLNSVSPALIKAAVAEGVAETGQTVDTDALADKVARQLLANVLNPQEV